MSNTASNVHFWNHLLATAELIESVDAPHARSAIMEQLRTICEAFGDCADPVESFEEFAVIRLSQAIHSALLMEDQAAREPGSPT